MALDRARIPYTVRAYEHDPSVQSYGLEAAEALGVEPARVFKTLLVESGPGKLAVSIIPVDRQLDLKSVAAALGVKRVVMADPAAAERVTGYVVGGISPIGQKKALPTLLDESAAQHATVLVSGGKRGFDIELTPSDLLKICRGRTASIARRG
ncbi:Cys-tRNA(Pro)/Cys-tRNA(Cys) deacylase [Tessaracoccus oleiagri]|uniref:Cys-tRNA(Pro)/Cys-tRNA(Cys) deacylase n=1 Tax=Tessaracoccus oleiagri TaxID=686624 RepID=A0A1G9K0X2_9ACTN|nr:Cys-tRNA(Pro)/Cys-tRNA(Cys) deacylase [Tessaracoccus oleiagri]